VHDRRLRGSSSRLSGCDSPPGRARTTVRDSVRDAVSSAQRPRPTATCPVGDHSVGHAGHCDRRCPTRSSTSRWTACCACRRTPTTPRPWPARSTMRGSGGTTSVTGCGRCTTVGFPRRTVSPRWWRRPRRRRRQRCSPRSPARGTGESESRIATADRAGHRTCPSPERWCHWRSGTDRVRTGLCCVCRGPAFRGFPRGRTRSDRAPS
jgi:hypothetical protein